MIVLNVTYNVKAGLRDKFYQKLQELQVPVGSRSEAGNLKYDYYNAVDNDNQLLLVEHWQDRDAMQLHSEKDYFCQLQGIKAEYLESTVKEEFEI